MACILSKETPRQQVDDIQAVADDLLHREAVPPYQTRYRRPYLNDRLNNAHFDAEPLKDATDSCMRGIEWFLQRWYGGVPSTESDPSGFESSSSGIGDLWQYQSNTKRKRKGSFVVKKLFYSSLFGNEGKMYHNELVCGVYGCRYAGYVRRAIMRSPLLKAIIN